MTKILLNSLLYCSWFSFQLKVYVINYLSSKMAANESVDLKYLGNKLHTGFTRFFKVAYFTVVKNLYPFNHY